MALGLGEVLMKDLIREDDTGWWMRRFALQLWWGKFPLVALLCFAMLCFALIALREISSTLVILNCWMTQGLATTTAVSVLCAEDERGRQLYEDLNRKLFVEHTLRCKLNSFSYFAQSYYQTNF